MEKLAKEGYFSECDFHLVAKVDSQGEPQPRFSVVAGKSYSLKHDHIADKKDAPAYPIPALSFELWEFNLSKKGFALANNQTTLQALKDWLKLFGGVRLYHRGVRVMP